MEWNKMEYLHRYLNNKEKIHLAINEIRGREIQLPSTYVYTFQDS